MDRASTFTCIIIFCRPYETFVCNYVPILCFTFCLHWTGLGFASGESLRNNYIVKRWFALRIFKIMRSLKNVLKVCIQCAKDIIKPSKYFLMGNEWIWIYCREKSLCAVSLSVNLWLIVGEWTWIVAAGNFLYRFFALFLTF